MKKGARDAAQEPAAEATEIASVAEIQQVITALHTTPVPAALQNSLLQTLAWQVFATLAECRDTRARVDQLLAALAERDRLAAEAQDTPQVDAVLAHA